MAPPRRGITGRTSPMTATLRERVERSVQQVRLGARLRAGTRGRIRSRPFFPITGAGDCRARATRRAPRSASHRRAAAPFFRTLRSRSVLWWREGRARVTPTGVFAGYGPHRLQRYSLTIRLPTASQIPGHVYFAQLDADRSRDDPGGRAMASSGRSRGPHGHRGGATLIRTCLGYGPYRKPRESLTESRVRASPKAGQVYRARTSRIGHAIDPGGRAVASRGRRRGPRGHRVPQSLSC